MNIWSGKWPLNRRKLSKSICATSSPRGQAESASWLGSKGTRAEASSLVLEAGTPAVLVMALTCKMYLSTNLPIKYLCLSSACRYLQEIEKAGASKQRLVRGCSWRSCTQVCCMGVSPTRCRKGGGWVWNLGRQSGCLAMVTAVMVIWRLFWTVGWNVLFQMTVLKNISPHLTPS